MRSIFLLETAILLTTAGALRAQGAGLVQITSPISGQAVTGVVTITGSATHDDFQGYDLAYAPAENPPGTWYPLGEPVSAPVTAGRLGLWDTTGIADGDYSLRLRVWLQNGTALVTQVEGLRVRNETPAETSTPAPSPTTAATPTAAPQATPTPAPAPTSPAAPGGRVATAFLAGVAGSLILLGALVGYSYARSTLRPRLAALRSRAMHRKVERRGVRRRGLR